MKQVNSWVYLPALYEKEPDPVLAELNLHTQEYIKSPIVLNIFDVTAISEGDDDNQSFVYMQNGLTFRIQLPFKELSEFIIHAQTQI
jgi:hypothetical protein